MYIKKIFNKEIEELKITDIEYYFTTSREESTIIEYKSYIETKESKIKDKENTILKTICGFLNSEGGIIIWGAPQEQRQEDGTKIFKDKLSYVTKKYNKDDLVSKYINRIIPAPSKIKCEIIQKDDTNNFIIIFEIEKSLNKPHQFEHRYWMRADGQTIKAPHHYIEALFKQIKFPDLLGTVKMSNIEINGDQISIDFLVKIENNSKFQNAEDPNFSFSFDGKTEMASNKLQNIMRNNLPYGIPQIFSKTIKINKNPNLGNNLHEIRLQIWDKTSPIKVSKYRIEIGDYIYDTSKRKTIIKKKEFIPIFENIFLFDEQ